MNTPAEEKRFVLELIDPTTGSIVNDVSLIVASSEELAHVIGAESEAGNPEAVFDLDKREVESIKIHFGLTIETGTYLVTLRRARKLDELPYKIHTNRELLMMLRGVKPFAYFSDIYPPSDNFELPEKVFEPHVSQGYLVKREYVAPNKATVRGDSNIVGTRFVLYALKHEEWRIDAFILLRETAARAGWSEGFERMLGSLLGYEEWQNEAFIEHSRRWKLDI